MAATGVRASTFANQADALFTQVELWGFSGVVSVGLGGDRRYVRAAGWSDRAAGERIDGATQFELGSIAKQFTAAAALVLAERGRLDLNAPISRYLPNVPPDKLDITVHHLLTHTSGIPRDVAPDFAPLTREELEDRVLRAPLAFSAGQRFAYSNAGYGLLAAIVERTAGIDFTTFVTRAVLIPSGLEHVGFHGDGGIPGARRKVARAEGSAIDGQNPVEWPVTWSELGSAGMLASADDLHRWAGLVASGGLLRKESWALARTPNAAGYGYGWFLESVPGGQVMRHGGAWYAYSGEIRILLPSGANVLVLSNKGGPQRHSAARVAAAFFELLSGREVTSVPMALDSLPPGIAACAGGFRNAAGHSMEVRREGEALLVRPTGAHAYADLLRESADSGAVATFDEFTSRTVAVARGIAAGDFRPLHAATDAARGQRYEQALRSWMAGLKDGSEAGVVVEAATPAAASRAWTIGLRMGLRERVARIAFTWSAGGRIVSLMTDAPEPDAQLVFRAVDRDGLLSYDLGTGRTVRATCRMQGGSMRLRIHEGGWTSEYIQQ